MRTTTCRCDRCDRIIESNGSLLEMSAGPLRFQIPGAAVDLCDRCATVFLEWMRRPPIDEPTAGR